MAHGIVAVGRQPNLNHLITFHTHNLRQVGSRLQTGLEHHDAVMTLAKA